MDILVIIINHQAIISKTYSFFKGWGENDAVSNSIRK